MNQRYPNLSKPLVIRGKTFKNRMLVAPLGYGPVDNSGWYFHQENIDYYEALARGGTARVITGDHPVNRHNAGYGGQRVDFYSPRGFGPPGAGNGAPAITMETDKSMEFLVRVCHAHDALIFTEFDHGGMYEHTDGVLPPYGPDSYVRPDGVQVVGMNREQIQSVYDDFARCALKAKEVGFDGVMIHGGHSHIQDQFRSAHTNHRTDEYGGSLENRCRFTLECLRAVREAVGPDFLLEFRFSVEEGFADGISVDESVEFLKLLDAEGTVDIYHVSTGSHFDPVCNQITTSPSFLRNFYNEEACRKIKAAGVKGAVAICNAVNDPEKAEQLVRDGVCDFVTCARQMNIADPLMPRKVLEGRGEYVNTCIRCYACYEGNECGVNPIVPGKYLDDLLYNQPQTRDPRDVVVVGGGLAGMKAAETAAARGHHVTLLEKTGVLGGLTARYAKEGDIIKDDIRRYRDNMIFRMYDSPNIRVKLNTEATPEMIRAMDPYALIVAVGSYPTIPAVPGSDRPVAMDLIRAYEQPETVGDTVVIVGGGTTACEMALHMGREGKKVYIINRRDHLMYHENIMMGLYNPVPMLEKFYAEFDRPVEVFHNCDCVEVLEDGVRCRYTDGRELVLKADSVVFASGMKANRDEALKFQALAPYVRTIGDCKKVGKIKHCTTQGYYAAVDIDK